MATSHPSADLPSGPPPRAGVIHDIGYRPYEGERLGEGYIFSSLYLTGLRHAFGLGRSAKSKVLPFVLLGLNLVPMLIVVAVMVVVRARELPIDYANYVIFTQVLVSVYAAAQGPVLFSRDLRHGSIVLYLARPMRSASYALARWGALATAIFLFVVVPILALFVGAMLAELDVSDNVIQAGQAAGLSVLLAMMLASVSGLFSALTVRRGFAVVGTIGVLIFGGGVVSAIQGISEGQGARTVSEVAGLFTPYTLYSGVVAGLTDADDGAIAPPDGAMTVAYVLVAVLVALGGLALLMLRYRKVAAR